MQSASSVAASAVTLRAGAGTVSQQPNGIYIVTIGLAGIVAGAAYILWIVKQVEYQSSGEHYRFEAG